MKIISTPSFWFKPQCYLCQMTASAVLCHDCAASLPWNTLACPCCARPQKKTQVCDHCSASPPPYHCVCALRYQGLMKSLIHEYKFSEVLYWCRLFAYIILQVIDQNHLPQAITAMPLHRQRLRTRGFNQAALIARLLCTALKIPYLTACLRVINTPYQHRLSVKQRQSNQSNAFECLPLESIHHLGIIDDIMTTGASINNLTACIKKTYPHIKIQVWCLARAVLQLTDSAPIKA